MGWCIGGKGFAARSERNPSVKRKDQSTPDILMMLPSNPKYTSHSSIVASSPHDSHSAGGADSEDDDCEISSERPRSIVLNEGGDFGLGDGYR